jgi:hypothetical protein
VGEKEPEEGVERRGVRGRERGGQTSTVILVNCHLEAERDGGSGHRVEAHPAARDWKVGT